MKILLRDQKTKLYYAGNDQWKATSEEAIPFPSSIKAWEIVMHCETNRDFEVVYSFANPAEDFFVPIEATSPRARL